MIFCSLTLVVALFWSTVRVTIDLWLTPTFSHGFLIIPGCLYLAWMRRKQVASFTPAPVFWALPLLALSGFAWLLGQLTATNVIQQYSLVIMIVVLIWGMVGTKVARTLAFSLGFLFFAVPVGEGLIPTLQDFASGLAVKLLDFSGVPVLLEGRFIFVPFATWEVAEACSGIRAFIACVTMGFLYAGLSYRSWGRRLGFLIASAVVPVLANGLRIYGIVLLGYLSGNAAGVAADHVLGSFLFTAIVMVLLLTLGQRWREKPQTGLGAPSVSPSPYDDSVSRAARGAKQPNSILPIVLFTIFGIAVVGTAPLSAKFLWRQPVGGESIPLRSPVVASPWSASDRDPYDWAPRFLTPSAELSQVYTSGDQAVKLYVAYYDAGQEGAKPISTANMLYDRQRWRRTREGDAPATLGGQSFQVHETSIRSKKSSLTVWNWYWVDGTFTGNEYLAKLLYARARLLRSRGGSAAIVMATAEHLSRAQTAEMLRDLLAHLALQDSIRARAENN